MILEIKSKIGNSHRTLHLVRRRKRNNTPKMTQLAYLQPALPDKDNGGYVGFFIDLFG